jgi:hypothetical protein
MDATLYTGDGTNGRLIQNSAGFQPDLVIIKSRSNALNHNWYDSNRGAPNEISSSTTNLDTSGDLTAFNTTGFTVNQTVGYEINHSAYTYVAWQWKAGGANTTNTSGTITSQVSANPTAGFSIVTYTGNGTAGATVGHGLGAVPKMIFVKNRSSAVAWAAWHTSIANTQYLVLNTTAEVATGATWWNSTSPTSSVISVGTSTSTNASGNTYVAYCWTPIAGFSQFGSYTGNGSTDGPFVYTGFRPKFIMRKNITQAYGWYMDDTSRNSFNVIKDFLLANSSAAEVLNDVNYALDIVSNGFKVRSSHITQNYSGDTYIYACFAENPLKFANAR